MDQQVSENVVIVQTFEADGAYLTLPEPTKQWLIYQEALKEEPTGGFRFIALDAEKELEARRRAGRTDLDLAGTIKRIDTE
jgi:hypothetical protein